MRQIEWVEDKALHQKVAAANINEEDIVLPCGVACELIAYAATQNIQLLGWDEVIIKDKEYHAVPGVQYEYDALSTDAKYIKQIGAKAVAQMQAVNEKFPANHPLGKQLAGSKLYFDLLFDI